MTAPAKVDLPPGAVKVGRKVYMTGAKGELVPIELVKDTHRLEDDAVRSLFGRAEVVAAEIAAFKDAAFADVDAFVDLLAERYKTKAGGEKGNLTLTSYDGLMRIQVQVADNVVFGPELQVAKKLVDECLSRWSEDSGPELRAVVMDAFRVDKEGKVNHSALFGLLRLGITDKIWVRAMEALRDSMKVVGSRRYIRFDRRKTPSAPWVSLSLNVATA